MSHPPAVLPFFLEYVLSNLGHARQIALDSPGNRLIEPSPSIAAAKISDPRVVIPINQDVLRLRIAPDDPGLVELGKRNFELVYSPLLDRLGGIIGIKSIEQHRLVVVDVR